MKKSISILLLLCMLVGLFGGVSAFAVEGEESIGDDIAVSDIVEEAEEVIEPEAEAPAAEPEAEPAPAEQEEPAEEEVSADEEAPAAEHDTEVDEEQPVTEAPASEEMAEELSEDGAGNVCKIDTTEYATIADALTAAGTVATTIVLIDDVQANVTIDSGKNITLDLNGYVLTGIGAGSVISVSGEEDDTPAAALTIQDSSTAKTGKITGGVFLFGGGIYNEGTLIITGGTICGNTAPEVTLPNGDTGNALYLGGEGGGIYNAGTLTIKGGTISGNNASYLGGGIFNDYDASLTISGGTISANTAKVAGGGIFNNAVSSESYEAGTVTISGGTIGGTTANADNTACYGGGICNDGELTINGGTISYNKAIYDSDNDEGGEGGGIYNDGNLTMSNASITDNKAESGGGIYNYGILTINSGTVSGNKATGEDYYTGYGGGIYNWGTFTMAAGSVTGNAATDQGGGICSFGYLTLSGKASVTGNTSTSDYPSGGVYAWTDDDSTITISGSVDISGNTTNGKAANLCLSGETDQQLVTLGSMSNTTPIGVSVMVNDVECGGKFTTNGETTDVQYFKADNGTSYAVSYNSEGYLELVKAVCFVDTNKNGSYDSTEISYATVQAAVDAAGTTATNIVMIDNSQENVTLTNTKNITLDLNGYVISGKGNSSVIKNEGTLTIRDSNKDNQSHKFTVGENGLWTLDEDSGTETVTGGCITGGTGFADGDSYRKSGGGIYNTGTLTVTGGNIIGNQAKMNGGGIYNYGTLTVNGGSITGNLAKAADGDTTHASTCGGGIYSLSQNCTISGGTISNNSARSGGGVDASGSMTISGTAVISDNTALYGGGIINYGTLTVTGGSISGNKAISVEDDGSIGGLGGGIYNSDNKTLNIQGGSVTGNTAEYGGGIYNTGALTMTDTAIGGTEKGAANTATYGGGIYNNSNGKLSIEDGSISGNEAEYGGGIYNKDTLTMTDGTISGNKATKNGGGICNYGSSSISGGSISGNKATENGGGVYLTINTNTAVGGSTNITGNTVSGEANNVYLDDSGDGAHAKMTIVAGDDAPTTMKIGVSIAENAVYSFKNPYQITTNGTADDRQYFSGDDGETIIYLAKEGGALYLQPGLEFTVEGLDDYVVGTKSADAVVTVGCEEPENDNDYDGISKDNFDHVEIGGKTVPAEYIEVEDGCIILTLSKDYLNKLAVGKYTMTVVLKDTAETKETGAIYDGVKLSKDFNVLPTETAKKQAPSTGDNNALGLWLGLASMSVIAIGAVLTIKRKEN